MEGFYAIARLLVPVYMCFIVTIDLFATEN